MANVSIIGSGVVGKATGMGLIKSGHDVVFIDSDYGKLYKLNSAGFNTASPEELHSLNSDIFMLTVPTPTEDKQINLRYISEASKNLAQKVLRKTSKYILVVVRSTVPPGTTNDVIIPMLEKYSGKKAGIDFGVCMNPEFLREKSAYEDFINPRLIIIGAFDSKSGETLENLYRPLSCPLYYVSLNEAETQKYIHNLYNACKISFFNEMRGVCKRIGIRTDRIFDLASMSSEACWNREYGIRNMGPYGGSCLPKDTNAFLSWAKTKLNLNLPMLKEIISVNEYIREKLNKTAAATIKESGG